MIMSKLGVSLNKLGTYLLNINPPDARKCYLEALEISKELVAKNRNAYLPDLAVSLGNISVYESTMGDFIEAKKHANEMINIYRELVNENEEVFLNDLGNALGNIGIILYKKDEYTEALKYYEEALSISRRLAARNPDVQVAAPARPYCAYHHLHSTTQY
ncbi:MAG: tetratricopeptide repeat protein [Saprospirales bacterium]|nr:tetratricopeptide repeat protein [Saprospirales bacterium]